MNYTSARYDAPYTHNASRGQPNGPLLKTAVNSARGAVATHSASSSTSSFDGEHNMAGVGSHLANGSGQYGSNNNLNRQHQPQQHPQPQQQQHHYDSSGEFDHRFPAPPPQSSSNSRIQTGAGQSMRAFGMQQQSQTGYASQNHRLGQLSDDYDGISQYAPYRSDHLGRAEASSSGWATPTPRADRDREIGDADHAFDFLLSPGLAPVGPISTSSSNLSPLPPHLHSGFPASNSVNNGLPPNSATPSRPIFNRSQTAMPAPSTSGRAFQAPQVYASQGQQHMYSTDHATSSGLASSSGPGANSHSNVSTGQSTQQQQGSRDYTPPPPITAQALLDIVLNLKADQPSTSNAAGSASSSMNRSQSANAANHLQQGDQTPAHIRNVSTGSNRSEEDGGISASQTATNLLVPSHPGMARTASSRNVNDSGASLRTVDLTHHRIAEVPSEVIDALEGTVGRLALGYNYIATLPPAFSRLGSTLRYLNIRLNMLTTFPPVLCEMPSLEILDISRNKIKRLPTHCGSLKGLRVFSISKNRVKRLPTYFADMKQLRVLKIDHNPLEWPPREITNQPNVAATVPADGQSKRDAEATQAKIEAQALQKWLSGLQEWIRDHAAEMSAQTSAGRIEEFDTSLPVPYRPEPTHSQSDSNILLAGRSDQSHAIVTGQDQIASATSPRPAPTVRSPRSGGKSPSELPRLETESSRLSQHGRSESHSLSAANGGNKKGLLRSKKSLPDLRQSHAQILDDRFNNDPHVPEEPHSANSRLSGGARRHHKSPSSISSGPSPITARPIDDLPTPPRSATNDRRTPARGQPHARSGSEETDTITPLPNLDSAQARARRNPNGSSNMTPHASTGERGTSGAYFKRLSMLPPSTISKVVPSALLQFMEGIRGIFFALSQIHGSLKQCIVQPATDRLPAVFTKMMASADDAMGFLIDALDKFDSTSRRGMPETNVVKDLVETCRENLTIFGKLVTIVLAQSKTLFAIHTDVRYVRTLVVGLYGGMGEIALSWDSLGPLRQDISAWLRGDIDLSPTSLQLHPATPSPREEGFSHSTSKSGVPLSPALPRGQASPALSPAGTPLPSSRVPLAKTRRHAGSFSKYNPQYSNASG